MVLRKKIFRVRSQSPPYFTKIPENKSTVPNSISFLLFRFLNHIYKCLDHGDYCEWFIKSKLIPQFITQGVRNHHKRDPKITRFAFRSRSRWTWLLKQYMHRKQFEISNTRFEISNESSLRSYNRDIAKSKARKWKINQTLKGELKHLGNLGADPKSKKIRGWKQKILPD